GRRGPRPARPRRWPSVHTTVYRARTRRPLHRTTGTAADGRLSLDELQRLPDQVGDGLGLDEEPVVAVDRINHVELGTAREELGEFFLQPKRIQPVRRDAAHDNGHTATAQ